jgi:hypothetical protein
MLFRSVVPISEREVKGRHVSTRSVELLEGALLDDAAILVEGDDVIAVRETLGCNMLVIAFHRLGGGGSAGHLTRMR